MNHLEYRLTLEVGFFLLKVTRITTLLTMALSAHIAFLLVASGLSEAAIVQWTLKKICGGESPSGCAFIAFKLSISIFFTSSSFHVTAKLKNFFH